MPNYIKKMTEIYWQQVSWSDDSEFEAFGSNHHLYKTEEVRSSSQCLEPSVKHSGDCRLGLLCWGYGEN